MKIKGFALGIRFDLLRATLYDCNEDDAGRRMMEELFSVLTTSDLKGLRIFGGIEHNDPDEFVYLAVIADGSLKEMRKIFKKLDDDAAISMYLAHSMPYVENNRLELFDESVINYFGKVQSDGSIKGGDRDCYGLKVPSKHLSRRPAGRGIKILLAPDSFKGTISSTDAIKRLTFAARRHFPGAKIVPVPIADGGEGTVKAMVTAASGAYRYADVTGPLGAKVHACYGVLKGRTAVIELAEASGLALCKEKDIMAASSFGTGELIRRALDEGLRKFVIGIGGSATNDCGMGLARALGVKFYDGDDNELMGSGSDLIKVKKIDLEYLNPAIKDAEFTLMCDVTNPLLGECGATMVYGPQKGATQSQLEELEAGINSFSRRLSETVGRDVTAFPGAGAAGGAGAMLMALLKPEVKSGIDAILDAVDFERLLKGVALVVTGEGCLDYQSVRYNKAVCGIMRRCAARSVPVAIITGNLGEGAGEIFTIGNAGVMPTVNTPMTMENAMVNAEQLFDEAADRMFRFIRMGRDVEKIGAPKKPRNSGYPAMLMPPLAELTQPTEQQLERRRERERQRELQRQREQERREQQRLKQQQRIQQQTTHHL